MSRDQLSFQTSTGYLLSRLGSLAERSWNVMLRHHNLTAHQRGVLLALREHGSLGQGALSAVMAVDPRNLGPILDTLAETGLIVRTHDPADRRRRLVALTASGSTAADALASSAADIEHDFLTALNPAEQTQLNRLLVTLYTGLTR